MDTSSIFGPVFPRKVSYSLPTILEEVPAMFVCARPFLVSRIEKYCEKISEIGAKNPDAGADTEWVILISLCFVDNTYSLHEREPVFVREFEQFRIGEIVHASIG